MNFTVSADHWIKLKESDKSDNNLDLSRELKKTLEYESVNILIVIGLLGTVTKSLVQRLEDLEIRGRVEIIQSTALLGSVRILKIIRET